MPSNLVQSGLHATNLRPVHISAVVAEVAAELLPRVVILADDAGNEHRVAGFLRLKSTGGTIAAGRSLPTGTAVWWQGQRMRMVRVER